MLGGGSSQQDAIEIMDSPVKVKQEVYASPLLILLGRKVHQVCEISYHLSYLEVDACMKLLTIVLILLLSFISDLHPLAYESPPPKYSSEDLLKILLRPKDKEQVCRTWPVSGIESNSSFIVDIQALKHPDDVKKKTFLESGCTLVHILQLTKPLSRKMKRALYRNTVQETSII